MFIERLVISTGDTVIRDMRFREGVNLIVDETPVDDLRQTGNNVGKTTVLKLIDYCLGAQASIVYTDQENKGSKYELVERFLVDREVLITLTLVKDLSNPASRRVVIQRNFLPGKRAVRTIEGRQVKAGDYERALAEVLLPTLPEGGKPSFRQAIGHNIRYDIHRMENTLKTLGPFGKGVEYEALYLYLLGMPHDSADKKQSLTARRNMEQRYLSRLLNGHSPSDYRTVLSQIGREIDALEEQRHNLALESDYAEKLEELDTLRAETSRIGTCVSQLELRISMIGEAREALLNGLSSIDLSQLRQLYDEAGAFIPKLHKSFEDLVQFHNTMIHERISFMERDLPSLRSRLAEMRLSLDLLVSRDRELADDLAILSATEEIDRIVEQLGEMNRQKGEYEARIEQIASSESSISAIDEEIEACEESIYSAEYEEALRERVECLNARFSQISKELYNETYMIGVDIKRDKNGNRYYDFHTLDMDNYSSGKKQGEVLAFDIAYTLFADDQGIECMHFLLNDRKELMHGNQLRKSAEISARSGAQLVVSILRDKLPEKGFLDANVVVRLSQDSKLFRIEELV